jgi:hypothetical protein
LKSKNILKSILISGLISVGGTAILMLPALLLYWFIDGVDDGSFMLDEIIKDAVIIFIGIFIITFIGGMIYVLVKNKTRKNAPAIISSILSFVIICILISGVSSIKEAKWNNEEYKDIPILEETILEQLMPSPEDSDIENIDRAFNIIKEDNKNFLKSTPRSENNVEPYSWERSDDAMGCRYSTYFEQNNRYDYNYKQVSCSYYYPDTHMANAGEIIFTSEYTFREGNIEKINLDFIIKDIENTFGQLEDEELFREAISKTINEINKIREMQKIKPNYFEFFDDKEIRTSSGSVITISNTGDSELNITGKYTVEIS